MAIIEGIELTDFHLRCTVTDISCERFGITVRDTGGNCSTGAESGAALLADVRGGKWQFGYPWHANCSYIMPTESIAVEIAADSPHIIDVIVRDIFFEAYVDGIWRFSRVIADRSRSGGIGFFVENGSAVFEEICIHKLEPMIS